MIRRARVSKDGEALLLPSRLEERRVVRARAKRLGVEVNAAAGAGGGIFFFSSRRRHTRCLSDWSSDVCSSDLTMATLGDLPSSCQVKSRPASNRSEEHTSELQSLRHLVCRLLLEKKNKQNVTLFQLDLFLSRDLTCAATV